MTPPSQRIHHQRSLSDALLRFTDVCCVMLGFWVATLYPKVYLEPQYLLYCTAAIIAVLLVGELSGLYRAWRGVALHREIAVAEMTWAYSLGILLIVGFLTRHTDMVARMGVAIAAVTVALLFALSRIGLRFIQRSLRFHGFNTRNMAIVGVNDLGIRLARNLEDSPELGLHLVGFFDDRPSGRTGDLPDDVAQRLGTLRDLVRRARSGEIDRVYVTLPLRAEKRVRDVLNRLADTTASVYIVPDFFVFELLHSRWTDINGLPVVSVFENPLYGVDGLLKRVCDVALASLMLLASFWPMCLIAILIKFTSPGPIFFRQRRYGLDGREILIWKFRSMLTCDDGAVVPQARQNDPRVTTVGALLRRASLDELPQLFNVLDGSMSLVGPRPHATAHNEQYRRLIPGYMLRHKVKPGITGLAQVLGLRGETDSLDKMSRRIQCDLQYIREWSLWMDVKILFKTIFVVMAGKNAY